MPRWSWTNGSNTARWILYPVVLGVLGGLGYYGFVYEAEPEIESLLGSADLYAQAGLLDQAEEACESALRRDPNNLHARLTQAFVADRRQDFERALKIYDHALTLTDDDALSFDIKKTRIDLLRRLDRFAEADRAIDALAAERGESGELWRLRGYLRTTEGDTAAALAAFSRYREFEPDSVDAACVLASALIQNDRLSEARDVLSRVEERERSAWPIWRTLARSCCEAGDREGAASALSQYVKLDRFALAKLRKDSFWNERASADEFREILN